MDDIRNLELELAALKRQRKEEKKAAKIQSQWVSVKQRLPDADSIRVIAWAEGRMERCWHKDGNWYVYDGTFFLTDKDKIDTVTHWMQRDWMVTKMWPMYGPGIKSRLAYYWRRFTDGAQDMAHDLRPKSWGGNAQLSQKVTFYRDAQGSLMTGLPDYLPAPQGYEKIVCNSVHDAERYSAMQRRQENYEHRRQSEERASVESEFADSIRSEMRTKMANARNNLNREFMRRALERMDGKSDPTRYERESYLHAEGYEKGR